MKASVSYPTIFEPFNAWDSLWVSGGEVWSIDASAPILQCLAMGYKEEQIVLDAIIDKEDHLEVVDASQYNAWQVLGRFMELEAYYNAHRMLMITQAAYPNVEYRHIIGPKQT